MSEGMIFYAHAHEFLLRGFIILGGLGLAYLLALAINAAYEATRGGPRR
jgi:hypothetical protein